MNTTPSFGIRLTASKTLYKGFELAEVNGQLRVTFAYNVHKLQYVKLYKLLWNPVLKVYATESREIREKFLTSLVDGTAEEWMAGRKAAQEKRLSASRALDAERPIPKPEGLSYMPFQRGGIAFVADLVNDGAKGAIIGDEMGLGKTIQAIGLSNYMGLRRVLVICPASLKGNWRKEFRKWTTLGLTVGIADSKLFPATDVVVINYDIFHKWADRIRELRWDLIVADEAHRLKNPYARRTQLILGRRSKDEPVAPLAGKVLLPLTGTPILNRPEEIYGIVRWVAPDEFPSRVAFEKKYAERYLKRLSEKEALDRLNDLQDKLRRSCMIRRLKADVLTELPAKIRQVIEIQGGIEALRAIADERKVLSEQKTIIEELKEAVAVAKKSTDEGAYRNAIRKLQSGKGAAMTELARVRKATAIAKIPYVTAFVDEALEESEGKLLIFAHHQEVVESFLSHYGDKAVAVYGKTDTKPEVRDAICAAFQTDPRVRVFIGSITAAGVGLTLTAATSVVFAELDWVPGNVVQAEDRAHRIGQKDSVLVQHLVLAESLDAIIANRIVEKADMIDAALDRDSAEIISARRGDGLLEELLGV